MTKRRRNAERFTVNEGMSATLAYTEGTPQCVAADRRRTKKARVAIESCVKEALQPVTEAFGHKIGRDTRKTVSCPPEDFPPEGKGMWRTHLYPPDLRKIAPLIPKRYKQRWNETWRKKGCKPVF